MNNSQTPRTDAATERVWHGAPAVMIYKHPAGGATIRTDEAESTYMVPADLARQLEREVAELREALERFAKEWRFLIQIGQLDDHGELAQAEAALKPHAQGGV